MAITFYQKQQNTGSISNPTTVSMSTGSQAILVVASITVVGGSRGGGEPTFDGVNMIPAGNVETSAEGSAELWYILNDKVPKSQANVVISVPNSSSLSITVIGSVYGAPVGKWVEYDSVTQTNGVSNAPSISVSYTAPPSLVVDSMFHGYISLVQFTNNRTILYSNDTGNQINAAQYLIDNTTGQGSNVTMSYTTRSSDDWCLIGASFNEINQPDFKEWDGEIQQNIGTFNGVKWTDVASVDGVATT